MKVVLEGEPGDVVAEALRAALRELHGFMPALLEVDVYIRLDGGEHYAATFRYVLRRVERKVCYAFKSRLFCSI